jgi:hypothetical protein
MQKQTQFEILTPSGFQPFDGIVKRYDHAMEIRLSDGTRTRCSFTHRWIDKEQQAIEAQYLCVGDVLYANVVVEAIAYIGQIDLYDPINVGGGNVYLSQQHAHHNCEFLGSANTLINSRTLASMSSVPPKHSNLGLDVYHEPIKDHIYVVVVDVSEGVGGDFSAFVVFDVTTTPYQIVAKYKNNTISPWLFPDPIYHTAKKYNDAYTLVESNNVGGEVISILFNDLEYENVLSTVTIDQRTQLSVGFGQASTLGVRTTKSVKRIGCANAKTLIEEQKVLIHDADIIGELSNFVAKNGTFKADDGYHDDLAMCIVLFGWMSSSQYFKDLTNVDLREKLFKEQMKHIEESIVPFGVIDTGLGDEHVIEVRGQEKRCVWHGVGTRQVF